MLTYIYFFVMLCSSRCTVRNGDCDGDADVMVGAGD